MGIMLHYLTGIPENQYEQAADGLCFSLQKEKGVFIYHIYFCYENKRIFVQKCYEFLHSMLYRSY